MKIFTTRILLLCILTLIGIVHCEDVTTFSDTISSTADTTTLADTQTSESTISTSTTTEIIPTSTASTADTTTLANTQTSESTISTSTTIEIIPTSTPSTSGPSEFTTNSLTSKQEVLDKLSNKVRNVLQHFQSAESLGFPGQTKLEDPLSIPPTNVSLGLISGEFYNVTVHGLSNFTVEGINTVLDQMEVYTIIKMKKIYIVGNCTVDTLIGFKTMGPFNITLTNVTAEGTVFLNIQPDGTLVANKTLSDMTYEELIVSTSSDGMLQTALSGAGIAVLAALKPYMLHQIDERINREVNAQLVNAPKMPAFVEQTPIDLAVQEGRKYVAEKYEPYTIEKILEHNSEFLEVHVGPVTVKGLSKFSRVGNVNVKLYNGTVLLKLRVITGPLRGKTNFFYDFGKIEGTKREGLAYFFIPHLQFEAKVNQSMNFKNKPILEDLQLETGQISIRFDGRGKLDYFVELIVKKLPTMLRHLIIDSLEGPIKQKIQHEILNNVDVEDIVTNRLPLFESLLVKSN